MAGEAATKAITQNPSGDSNPPLVKKKRNLPGTPDPDAEVIALTPKTLMATNRFLCEICGKGFQRDQNLQLHRRGHNLPWKLRQRSTKEPRKRVYVCPEKTCVHNHPSRALGDLTGIKKHFCRKHGEKKWKCDKCSKRYAVQSDWKAHSKTCGTREYRCDCGTLFSRRDSFVTHRAFCDALAEETARVSATANMSNPAAGPCGLGYHLAGNAPRPSLVQHLPSIFKPIHSSNDGILDQTRAGLSLWMSQGFHSSTDHLMSNNLPDSHHIELTGSGALQADPFGSCLSTQETDYQMNWVYGKKISCSKAGEVVSSTSLPTSHTKEVGVPHLASVPSLYSNQHHHNPQHSPTDMSATALLQKAAQMGATSTTPSLFGSFGTKISSSDHSSHLQGGHKFEGVNQSFGTNMPAEYHCLSNLSNMTSNQSPPMYPAKRHKSQKDDLEGGETRDFLGVGVPTLCPPSTQGWI